MVNMKGSFSITALLRYYHGICLEGLMEAIKKTTEIEARHLQPTSLQNHRYASLFSGSITWRQQNTISYKNPLQSLRHEFVITLSHLLMGITNTELRNK
jgi:hypothetical protein